MIQFILVNLCQVQVVSMNMAIQIPEYEIGSRYSVSYYGQDTQKNSFIIEFESIFNEIPQILLSSSYHYEASGINGFMIEAENITQTQFTLVFTSFSNLLNQFSSEWIAINDQTICVHYSCFQPDSSNLIFRYNFNYTYYWLTNPVGALFITGQYKINFNNQSTYRMGASLSKITMSGFSYTFLYESTDYSMCIHSIFSPPEFLQLYPNIIDQSNFQPDDESEMQLDILEITPMPSVYLAGFASYYQSSSRSQYLQIYHPDYLAQQFLIWYSFEPEAVISIMRIQYQPLNCALSSNTINFSNSTGSFCQCQMGYYFADYTLLCQECSNLCFGCQSTPNNCNQCGINQTLITNPVGNQSCVCNDTYYLINGTNCDHCDNSCVNCDISPTNCTSCGQNQFLNNNKCSCNEGYYLISGTQCGLCSTSCVTCILTPATCTTCGLNQSLNNDQCNCNNGYYLITGTQCGLCDTTCINCISLPTQCTSCGQYQNLNNNICSCNDGYYLITGTQCGQCDTSCQTCHSSPTTCTSCGLYLQLNNNKCTCNDGYYLITGTQCGQCDYSCQTCEQAYNMCTSCGLNAQLYQNNCNCDPGYYRGEESNCQKCDISCLLCQSLNLCTSCQSGYYFEIGQCHACDKNCLTCDSASTNCKLCKLKANLNDKNQCICNPGYYMDSQNNCFQCTISCEACIGPFNSDCTLCPQEKKLINGQCFCPDQQYMDNQGHCQQCDQKCDTCSGNSSSCLKCKPNLNNYFNEGQCLSCKEKAAMNVDICNYADCTDQVWTKGEQCDDGNDIDRDGCSNCQIDSNYKCINVILEKSLCYTCSKGCLQCGLDSQKLVTCQQCQDGYYLNNNQCLLCSANCVTCSSFRQCLTCSVMGFMPDSNGRCPQCEDNAGFYTIGNLCQSKCGDFIIAGTEDCDDGNLMNGDGCSQDCSLEYGYYLQDGKVYQIQVPNSSVQYPNSTTLTSFIINTDQTDEQLCPALQILIDYFNNSAYSYNITSSNNELTNQVTCQILFNFTESLNSTSLIHFYIPYVIKSSRRLLNYFYREVIIVPRNVIIYSQSQTSQAESVQGTSSTLTFALYFIGPGTVLLGGFECFFRILDILSWINNLNFINIQFPLNVGMLLQNSGWASIQLIPQFLEFNQPSDPYYTESPSKFMELGVDPLFINNAYQSLSIIIVILACHSLTKFIYQAVLCFNNINKENVQKSLHDRNKFFIINIIAEQVEKVRLFNQNFISHLIQGFNLAFLDLVLAIVMQILYFKLNMLNYYPVFLSYLLALIAIVIVTFMILLSYHVSNRHSKTLSRKTYQNQFGFFYEDINKQSKLALKYNVFNLLRKSLFIMILILFYNNPLLQAPFCCVVSLVNIVLIVYENPFENRKAFMSNVVPDFCIFGLMLISSFLALDDQVSILTIDMRFQIGWAMLGLIGISIFIQLFYVFQSFVERSKLMFKFIFD